MKQDNKRDIWDVLKLLQKRDPDWEKPKIALKFRILYSGWIAQELRHGRHGVRYFSLAWKRQWLKYDDWVNFRNYALQ